MGRLKSLVGTVGRGIGNLVVFLLTTAMIIGLIIFFIVQEDLLHPWL